MIKKLFVLVFVAVSLAYSQTSDSIKTADSVNISQMVQRQIYKAHQKDETSFEKKELLVVPVKNQQSDFNFSGTQMKLALLFVMIITAAYMLVKKRKKQEEVIARAKPVPVPEKRNYDKDLKLIRTGLKDNAPFFMLSEEELSNAARDLKISKGELYLAAVLKSQELAKIKNNMFGVYND